MITERDKEKSQKDQLESRISLFEEAVLKAEKYERLQDNKDWQGYLADLEVLMDKHELEIKSGISLVLDAPNTGYVKMENLKQVYVSSKQDWIDFVERHEIQKQELLNWIREPDRILKIAAAARERIPDLKKQLKELTHVPAAVGNGQ